MAGSGWRITSQVSDQVQVNQASQAITGVMVYFVTGDGNEGSVFVPNPQYQVPTVRKMVHAQATLIDQVGQLSAASGD